MPRYHYDVSISRQKRFVKRFKKLLYIIGMVLVLIGFAIGIDSYRQFNNEKIETGAPSVTELRPSTHELRTTYFAFTAPSGWVSKGSESTNDTFVYRRVRGQITEQELTIYVNNTNFPMLATYVLPVRIDESNGRIIPGEKSAHCSGAAVNKVNKNPQTVTLDEVTFGCNVDNNNYIIVVGERGGTEKLLLKRPNNTTATYVFMYRSSSNPPESNQLIDILNSFHPL